MNKRLVISALLTLLAFSAIMTVAAVLPVFAPNLPCGDPVPGGGVPNGDPVPGGGVPNGDPVPGGGVPD